MWHITLLTTALLIASSHGLVPQVKLNDGRDMPSFGLGTWQGFKNVATFELLKNKDETQKAVEDAIDAGYRLIDTAYLYGIEDQVGAAIHKKISEGVVKREDIFVVTKLWSTFHAKNDVIPALKASLSSLKLDYVDLYLIHSPVAIYPNITINNDLDYVDTWESMIEAKKLGLTKSIGVSNFNQKQIERLLEKGLEKPAVLQVEINLNLQQPSLLDYCRKQNIHVQGYTPFGSLFSSKGGPNAPPPRADDPHLVKIAEKYNKTVTQVILRYLVELGVVPIPKSITKSRIEENLQVFDFQLSKEERDQLRAYDKNYRTLAMPWLLSAKYYPFEL